MSDADGSIAQINTINLKAVLSTIITWLCTAMLCAQTGSKETVEQWRRYEIVLDGPSSGNPFTDVHFSARFSSGNKTVQVHGFYDGAGKYKIRFMPTDTGTWSYVTASNNKQLNNKTGRFTCVHASRDNHGPVQVWNTYDFRYADGKTFYPFGTTLYAWTHQQEGLQEQTLQTLKGAPFNKVRMCVFPKYYNYVEDEPPFYPYKRAASSSPSNAKASFTWNFSQFEPAFFQHLEQRIDDLDKLGIEADLIIFHPYDKGHWGFDSMGKENDLFYIRYLVARLSSFKNIWWSMANEFDFVKSKPRAVWDDYAKEVVEQDPYRHLCSIHNGNVYYDHWKPWFTHVSIQNGAAVEDFGRANLLRDVYFKPVVYDEVCYEGNLTERWGRLSGEEMADAFWQGIIAGTYVTHGETFRRGNDPVFWARGGKLTGESPARIGFLKKLLEQGPGPLRLADEWKDEQTAFHDSSYYLIYFGKKMQHEWTFSLPRKGAPAAGTKFKADLIDTWNMTITPLEGVFELAAPVDYRMMDRSLKKIRLPYKPYMAIRLRSVS